MPPALAAQTAVDRVSARYPDFSGAVVAVSSSGEFGAGCHGLDDFPFTVADGGGDGVTRIERVPCPNPGSEAPPTNNDSGKSAFAAVAVAAASIVVAVVFRAVRNAS